MIAIVYVISQSMYLFNEIRIITYEVEFKELHNCWVKLNKAYHFLDASSVKLKCTVTHETTHGSTSSFKQEKLWVTSLDPPTWPPDRNMPEHNLGRHVTASQAIACPAKTTRWRQRSENVHELLFCTRFIKYGVLFWLIQWMTIIVIHCNALSFRDLKYLIYWLFTE